MPQKKQEKKQTHTRAEKNKRIIFSALVFPYTPFRYIIALCFIVLKLIAG
jgi:hypothetical protein